MASTTSSIASIDADFTLDISDVEICQVLSVLNLEAPDFLPVDLPPTPGGPLKNLNIPMEELTDAFLTYDAGGNQTRSENAFVGIRDVLEWCRECWAERQREEDEAKRQR